MKSIFLLFLIAFSYGDSSFSSSKVAEVIKDLLIFLNRPARVNLMVCWEVKEVGHFLHVMNRLDERAFPSGVSPISPSDQGFSAFKDELNDVFVLDLSCNGTLEVLSGAGMYLYWHYKWIILDSTDDSKIFEQLKEVPFTISSEAFYFQAGNNGSFLIREVFRINQKRPLQEELFGIWSNGKFYDYRSIPVTSRRRQNLRGAILRGSMVITNNDTLNHLTDYRDQHIDTISKVNYFLTNYLISFLNASIRYSIVNTWGYYNKSTSDWSGMIGELTRDEADIGATALFFTVDRIPVIDYLAETVKSRSKFVFQSPKLSYTDNVFLLPFSKIVWILSAVLVVVVAIFLALATYLEWKVPLADDNLNDSSILHPSLYESFLVVLSAACQQGSSTSPKSQSARLIMAMIFIILMFLYVSYSANIVALLQAPSTKIRTLNDLLSSRLKLGVDDTVYNRFYFSHETEPVQRKIYEQKVLNKDNTDNFLPLADGVARIRHGLYAFHMEVGPGYKIILETFKEDEKCGLQEISYLKMIDPYYAIQKNSSYRELIKIGLLRLNEHGLQDRENVRLYAKKPQCSVGSGGKFISVSLIDTEPAILLLVWGFVASGAIFAIEWIVWRSKDRIRAFVEREIKGKFT